MCDTAVRVLPGRVLFAKNSDRDPNEGQLLAWHPAADHEAGRPLRCTHVRIPQAAHTHAVLISRPFWMWGAEMGANEHGLVIGNEAVFTRQPLADTGLTGMDLVRLALERTATAQEAVGLIASFLTEPGQGGGCGHEDRSFSYHNSFLIADPAGAHVLETAGKEWASERVEGARSISNGLTIEPFASQHRDWIRTKAARAADRRACTEASAARAQEPGDLMALLRDHEEHGIGPVYHRLNGALGAPCVHAGGQVVNSQTTSSWVAELTREGARHWVTGTAAPCTSLFKPVRVDDPLDLGPEPTDQDDCDSLWWRHERLHRAVMRDPARLAPLFREERDATEAAWLARPPEPKDAFAEGDRLLRAWTERVAAAAPADRRPGWVRRYWAERARRAAPAGG